MALGILNFGHDGSKRLGSCSSYFTSGKRAPVTHYVGDSVDPRVGLHVVVKSRILTQARTRHTSTPSSSSSSKD
jgi:hypothetical protein